MIEWNALLSINVNISIFDWPVAPPPPQKKKHTHTHTQKKRKKKKRTKSYLTSCSSMCHTFYSTATEILIHFVVAPSCVYVSMIYWRCCQCWLVTESREEEMVQLSSLPPSKTKCFFFFFFYIKLNWYSACCRALVKVPFLSLVRTISRISVCNPNTVHCMLRTGFLYSTLHALLTHHGGIPHKRHG